MKQLLLLGSILFMLSACEKDAPIGKWDDIIKLSQKELSFDVNGGTATVTTEGSWWWVIAFEAYVGAICESQDNPSKFIVKYQDEYFNEIIEIGCDWFSVVKDGKQKLIFTIKPNRTGVVRKLSLNLEAGDYFTSVTLTQAAK